MPIKGSSNYARCCPQSGSAAAGLLLRFGIMALAKQKAEDEIKKSGGVADEYMINVLAKKYIVTEDKDIMGKVINAMKNSVGNESDETLSVWLSQKRVGDYVSAINGRDTKEIYNYGMVEWIEYITDKNNEYVKSLYIRTGVQNNFVVALSKIIPVSKMAVANEVLMGATKNG